MSKRSFCPADLSCILRHRWQKSGHDAIVLPGEAGSEVLIDTAYQASLLREEDDRPATRKRECRASSRRETSAPVQRTVRIRRR